MEGNYSKAITYKQFIYHFFIYKSKSLVSIPSIF